MNTSVSSPSRASANNVTAENFTKKAVAFVKASESGEGFVIAIKPYPGLIIDEDNPFKPTPRQWGAWMAYWARLPYKTKAMQVCGYATTPAEWPHEFDAHATMQGDESAGWAFETRWRQERESRAFHVGGLVKASSKALEAWRYERARIVTPPPQSHLDPTAGPPMDVADFPSVNASPAEVRAWEARQKAGEAA